MSKKIIVLQAMPGNYDRPLEEQKSMLKSMREDIDKTGIVIIPKGFTYSIKEIDDVQDKHEKYLKKNSGIKTSVVIDGKEVANAVSKYTTVDKRKY
nr:MAG TPA: hypothetical protein [Caudoviricetes sp.]